MPDTSDLSVTDPLYPEGKFDELTGAVAALPGDSERLGRPGPPLVAPPAPKPDIKPNLSFEQAHAVVRKAYDELRLSTFRRGEDPPILTSSTPEGPFHFQLANVTWDFFPTFTESELRAELENVVKPLTSTLPPLPPPPPPNAATAPLP